MSDNTGGPAFPNEVALNTWQRGGMTLRDYFAAKAMQGLMANPDWNLDAINAAKEAYTYADAMLKVRAQ